MIESILIIPDCHSKPSSSSERFTWLGEYIVDTRPTHIVCLGDFLDMKSLSSYDKGKGSGEGERVKADINAGIRDMNALWSPVVEYNTLQKTKHKKAYLPNSYFLMGNHEDRLEKYLNDHPGLIGSLDYDFLDSYGWEVYDFLNPLVLEDVVFSHFFSGASPRAIGGVNGARSIMQKCGMSCVAGHSHLLDFAVETRKDGTKTFGLVAGWYGDEAHSEKWSRSSEHTWWSGVTVLHNVENGFFERKETISQKWLKDTYGK